MFSKRMEFGERRLYPRKACVFKVEVDDYYRSYACDLRDLSLGGALLERPPRFMPSLGQELLLSISFRNRPGAVIVKGMVVRFQDEQLAVVFEKNLTSTLTQAA